MNDLLAALYSSPIGLTIRENELLFPWIEVCHVLAITLVFGSIALVDLRLIGVRSLNRPISKISDELLPVTWLAFTIAAGLKPCETQVTIFQKSEELVRIKCPQ